MSDVHVLGIRHHGPGSARSVASALAELAPSLILVEGPPELDTVVGLAASPDLRPPVAGLVYVPDEPRRASFYPLADFSPEWIALRHGAVNAVPVRFIDLPAAHALADRSDLAADPEATDADEADDVAAGGEQEDDKTPEPAGSTTLDPIGALAGAAGYDDPERWWEDVIEHRHHGVDVFEVVAAAMGEFRAASADAVEADHDTQRREAAMRKAIRAAVKQESGTIAVVCGAWHTPVLDPAGFPGVAADNALLSKLPKVKVAATWVPYTSRRLARTSGYGAGVTAPGWYRHLFTSPDQPISRWMVDTARALRRNQLDASVASTIEAVRLVDALAALRGRPAAGLTEVLDATRSVLCGGYDLTLELVADDLLVGSALGSVPDETPMVPVAQDLARQQKRLRLKVSAAEATVELDLRKHQHRQRSVLFHRLGLIGMAWAEQVQAGRTLGTFKEVWSLAWKPELAVVLIEAGASGTTVEEAAASQVVAAAGDAGDLAALTAMVEASLLADLPEAGRVVMDALQAKAAQDADLPAVLHAIEPLARVRRYGDVRQTDVEVVGHVLAGLIGRGAVGLAPAAAGADDDRAAVLADGLEAGQRGVATLGDEVLSGLWLDGLARLAGRDDAAGALVGRATRLLLDAGRFTGDEAARRLSLVLSLAGDPARAAAWLEGFLAGDVSLLLHDREILAVIDGWLSGIGTDTFDDLLPLLRRAFSAFERPARQRIGVLVRNLDDLAPVDALGDDDLDPDRAAVAGAAVLRLLGVGS